MYSKLIKYKENKNLVAIYSNEEYNGNFMVGYVCDVKNDKAMILNVGIHGEYDGYTGMYVDDIFRIETNSKYLDKIDKLKSFNEKELLYVNTYDDIFKSLIKLSLTKYAVVAISYGNNEEIKGYIKEYNDTITILELNEYGEEEGENIVKSELINRVVVDDIECRDIKKLHTD